MVVAISVISSTLLSMVCCNKSLQGHYLMEAVLIFIKGETRLEYAFARSVDSFHNPSLI